MATMFKARNFTTENVIEYLQNENIAPIYKVLFLYFNKQFPYIDDLITFTYYFSELALQSIVPNEVLHLLFKKLRYCSKTSVLDTKTFFSMFERDNSNIFSRLSTIYDCFAKKIGSFSKLAHNEYFAFVHKYMQRALLGFSEYMGRKTFISFFQGKESLENLSRIISSPIIIQHTEHGKKVSTLDNQTNTYELALLFGVATLLNSYIKNDLSPMTKRCIFLEDIPVCELLKENDVDTNACLKSPFYINYREQGNCIFYNSSLILGMLPDEEIARYKDTGIIFKKPE